MANISVPSGKRTEPKLAFQTNAKELADYTTTTCNNNNIFPKRDRWMIAGRMVNAVLTMMVSLDKANGVFVSSYEDYKKRLELQEIAKDALIELSSLLDLAYIKYPIESKKIEHWIRLIVNEKKLITKWMKSDKDRFKSLK